MNYDELVSMTLISESISDFSDRKGEALVFQIVLQYAENEVCLIFALQVV